MKIKLSTKINVTIFSLLLIIISMVTVLSVNRTISDTQDTIATFVRNSNGNYWTATGANIQIALWDLNATGGTVWVGSDITISIAIYLVNNTSIDFQWHTITLANSAGIDVINIGDGTVAGGIENVTVMNGIFNGNKDNQAEIKSCIFVQRNSHRITIRDNIFYNWYGKAVTVQSIVANKCTHISVIDNKMKGFQQGIDSDGVDFDQVNWGVISGNTIEGTGDDGIDVGSGDSISICNNVLRDCKNGIEFYASKGEIVGNTIDKIADYGIVLDNCRTTAVTGNYLYAIGKHGIRCLYAYGCSITGNTFWRCSFNANNTYDDIHLESSAGNHCTYNIITGNSIIEDYTNKPKCGINESDVNQDYNIISENTIFGAYASINKSGLNTIVKDNIGYDYNSLFPYYVQVIPPTLLENTTAYWYNTTGGWLYQVANSYGSQYYWNGSSDVVGDSAIYAQLSSSVDQTFAATGTGYNITFNTNDEINGITHSTVSEPQNITIVTTGVYSIMAQPQVHAGAGASGYFHMWLRKDTGSGFADVANTNVELTLASNEEDVIPLIAILPLNAGDIIRVNASVGHTGIELDAQTPTAEPAIPSIIFSMYRIGS